MNLLQDVITYVRRIVKTPSPAVLSDNLICDYINRFWLMDMDARVQLYDFRTKYQFQTIPNVCDYNMPLYNVQTSSLQASITPFPVYQGFMTPAYVNGIQIPFYNYRDPFWKLWPNYVQPLQPVAIGDGSTKNFSFSLPYFPAIPGHLDMSGIIAATTIYTATTDPIFANDFTNYLVNGTINIPTTSFYPGVYITYTNANGSNTTISDSGVFLQNGTGGDLYGLLIQPGNAPYGNLPLSSGATPNVYSTSINTVNYATGQVNVQFPNAPISGSEIQVQSYFFEQGIPRAILYWDNCLTIRPPPNTQYLIELDAYLTPAAFLATSQAIPFAYMAEYIARGAARKILSDTGDLEQFQFYEPLFREQETLVWKRSQRIFTATRTGTIFSDLQGPQSSLTNIGQGAT
jgi:hypothetical protein